MNKSGASTQPSADGTTQHAYLVPTAAGVRYAVSLDGDPAKRALLLALLRGASGIPFSLDGCTRWTGLTERRAIASLLFSLQREGLLTSDATPLALPRGPLSRVLGPLLERIANHSEMVLADSCGLCIAQSGLSMEMAEQLAARVASLDPRLRRLATEGEAWGLGGDGNGPRLLVRAVHLPPYRFLLVSGASADLDGPDFVQLMGLLAPHCLGPLPELTSTGQPTPP